MGHPCEMPSSRGDLATHHRIANVLVRAYLYWYAPGARWSSTRSCRASARRSSSYPPSFICSSATIANPRGLAEGLVEQPFELVSESGAPSGEKFFLFVNPPVVNRGLGIRRSYLAETRRVALEFLKRRLQLIVFAQSRLATEIHTTFEYRGGVTYRPLGRLSDRFDRRRLEPVHLRS